MRAGVAMHKREIYMALENVSTKPYGDWKRCCIWAVTSVLLGVVVNLVCNCTLLVVISYIAVTPVL